ncbi:MAG: hypothetical protein AUG74_15125 [Bacteroidetes bacterium 13_1_20CM_4_60_6]|nr:MAG: hypothetical protein AUG74_15125 [Bacteroidetes bacterium 13_1_20CM_4_60_6]
MIEDSDLLRLVDGECSPEEARAIQAWIAADPARGELLDQVRAVWRLTGDTSRPWDLAGARDRLLRVRGRHAAQQSGGLPARSRATGLLRMVGAGPLPVSGRAWVASPWVVRIAVTLVLVIAGWAAWQRRAPAGPAREYVTAPGQRLAVSFSDGSRVLLGVASRLRVPWEYGVRTRAVELEGEAYFVVRHDPAHPFLVRTAHGTTEDLGTEFDVRAYREERSLQVVVALGRVALRRAGGADSLLLHPRDRGVIDASGTVSIVRGVSLTHYLAWTRGTLRFDDAPLGGVLAQLERWYDLEIQTTDRSLARERLTIAFTTASPDEALSALARVLGARFTRDDRVVRLIPVHRGP